MIEETAIRHFARREESRDHLALGVEDVGVEIDLQAGHRPERSGLHFEGVELLFGRGADSYCLTALVRSGCSAGKSYDVDWPLTISAGTRVKAKSDTPAISFC